MALSSGISFIVSSAIIILLFSGLQANKQWITSSPPQTLFGGFLGSLIFVCSVTNFQSNVSDIIPDFKQQAVGNLETMLFGKNFQTKLFPEVAACYLFTFLSTAMVHRICVTSAFILSSIALYYMNIVSQKTYAVSAPVAPPVPARKKKH